MPTVSVIAPFYGVEDYARPCIESALGQTYLDFELILVDDGSPDGCGAILDSYAADPRVRVVHKANGGLSSARNAGLDVATGTYVYFLDGDDLMEPNLLETVVREMDGGTDLVAFNYRTLTVNPAHAHVTEFKGGRHLLESDQDRIDYLYSTIIAETHPWNVWALCYRRDLIDQHGLRFFDNSRIFAEDMLFTLCYLAHVRSVTILADALYRYRIRKESLASQYTYHDSVRKFDLLAHQFKVHLEESPDCAGLLAAYPVMHYLTIRGSLLRKCKAWIRGERSLSEVRREVREEAYDYAELQAHVRSGIGSEPARRVGLHKGRRYAIAERYGVPCLTQDATPPLVLSASLFKASSKGAMWLSGLRQALRRR